MYVSRVLLFIGSPLLFSGKNPSKPDLNVTSNREKIHDTLQHGLYLGKIYQVLELVLDYSLGFVGLNS